MSSKTPFILASQSPRRAQLLREAGFVFEQRSPPYADPDQPPGHLRGGEAGHYAVSLAQRKARSMAAEPGGPATLLAADTICVDHTGRLVGKPTDGADAGKMIRSFVAGAHRVITGVCLARLDGSGGIDLYESFADTATVVFGPIDEAAIDAYTATDDWRGKAGGYNLFDRQAAGWPIDVQGDPAAVVGLPMARLLPLLAASLHSGG